MAPRLAGGVPLAWTLLGPRTRAHLRALDAFSQAVDAAGPGGGTAGDARLERMAQEVDRLASGRAVANPLMRGVANAVARGVVPAAGLRRLIDVVGSRPAAQVQTWTALVDESRRVAEPAAELLLGVFGAATADRVSIAGLIGAARRIARRLCAVSVDHAWGRVHLPAQDMRLVGCGEADLEGASAGPGLRALLALEAERTRELLTAQGSLRATFPLRPRLAVAGLVADAGGHLGALLEVDYDVLGMLTWAAGPGR